MSVNNIIWAGNQPSPIFTSAPGPLTSTVYINPSPAITVGGNGIQGNVGTGVALGTGAYGLMGNQGIGIQGAQGVTGYTVGFQPSIRKPADLVPMKFDIEGVISYRSSERNYEYHCPFGPAKLDEESKPCWFLDGHQLNDHAVQLMQEILSDMTNAPLWINHKIFKYPAQWVLQHGPTTEYWDGSKYESSFIKKYSKLFSGLETNWWLRI